MAPREKVEFVLLRIIYVPYIPPAYPRIDFHYRRTTPANTITLVRDWFDRVMTKERNCLPSDLKIRFCEWRIVTGNAHLFTIQGYRFDKIMLLLGEENIYWIFYQNMPLHRRVEGSGFLQVSYCSCCLNRHYMKIMDKIKDELAKITIC